MKIKVIIALALTAVAAFSIYFYNGVIKSQIDNETVKNKVIRHLNREGYRSEDYSIDVSYHWENKLLGYNPYAIKVIFKDEQPVIYYYNPSLA